MNIVPMKYSCALTIARSSPPLNRGFVSSFFLISSSVKPKSFNVGNATQPLLISGDGLKNTYGKSLSFGVLNVGRTGTLLALIFSLNFSKVSGQSSSGLKGRSSIWRRVEPHTLKTSKVASVP